MITVKNQNKLLDESTLFNKLSRQVDASNKVTLTNVNVGETR